MFCRSIVLNSSIVIIVHYWIIQQYRPLGIETGWRNVPRWGNKDQCLFWLFFFFLHDAPVYDTLYYLSLCFSTQNMIWHDWSDMIRCIKMQSFTQANVIQSYEFRSFQSEFIVKIWHNQMHHLCSGISYLLPPLLCDANYTKRSSFFKWQGDKYFSHCHAFCIFKVLKLMWWWG